jgi:hypothetical protein
VHFNNVGVIDLLQDIDFVLQTKTISFTQLAPKWISVGRVYFEIILMATLSPVTRLRPFLTVAKLPLQD